MDTLQTRLQRAMREGNLTVSDLARWFDRPHPTVRGWVLHGRAVGGGQLDAAFIKARLDVLETRIRKKRGFPVPRLSPTNRLAYLAKIQASA